MNLLLDTHVFLWLALSPKQVSQTARAACADPDNTLHLSMASLWEARIKADLGRLELEAPLTDMLQAQQDTNALQVLPIEPVHVNQLESLEHHHGDPFDRLIIAQAIQEDMALVSGDAAFQHYSAKLIW